MLFYCPDFINLQPQTSNQGDDYRCCISNIWCRVYPGPPSFDLGHCRIHYGILRIIICITHTFHTAHNYEGIQSQFLLPHFGSGYMLALTVFLLGDGTESRQWSLIYSDDVLIPVLLLVSEAHFLLTIFEYYQRYLHPIQAAIIYALEPFGHYIRAAVRYG